MSKKKPELMSPEEFYEYEQMEDLLYRKKEAELLEKAKLRADKKKARLGKKIAGIKSRDDENRMVDTAALKVEQFGTEVGVMPGIGRSWIHMVNKDGVPMDCVESIYEHYQYKTPVGMEGDDEFVPIGVFYMNLRLNFMQQYACFLNIMVAKSTYSEFKKVSYVTVCRWAREKKLDAVEIDGIEFILIPLDEMKDYNEFLMQRTLKTPTYNKESETNRRRTVTVWKKSRLDKIIDDLKKEPGVIGNEPDIISKEPDSVADWVESEGMSNIPFNKKEKISSENAYVAYKKYCRHVGIKPLETKRLFMANARKLGYKDCGGKFRGIYWYSKERPSADIMNRVE
jgi:hypothetical protein